MSNEVLASILYFVVSFSWTVYVVQELFVSGSSALNMAAVTSEEERRQIQVATGIHWDGIEVWFVAAIALTFGSFPLAFATTFTHLYIPIFLLLYALIMRGVAIEVIYKIESERWIKNVVYAWTISSILIVFFLGIYLSNTFLGFPLDSSGNMTKSFASVFNVSGIAGGLLFVVLALHAGAGWIHLTTEGDLGNKAVSFLKKIGIVYMPPIFVILVFMGFNNTEASIFIGDIFSQTPVMFVLPAFTVIFAIVTMISGYQENPKRMFVNSLITMWLFLSTGFIGMYPNMVASYTDFDNSITVFDAMARTNSLEIILIAVVVFFPIVIGYQTWKYIRFTDKVKLNDE